MVCSRSVCRNSGPVDLSIQIYLCGCDDFFKFLGERKKAVMTCQATLPPKFAFFDATLVALMCLNIYNCGNKCSRHFKPEGRISTFSIMPLDSQDKKEKPSRMSFAGRVENPKLLAAAFALAVTERCDSPDCWVARNGVESIFRTLERILPKVERKPWLNSKSFGKRDFPFFVITLFRTAGNST